MFNIQIKRYAEKIQNIHMDAYPVWVCFRRQRQMCIRDRTMITSVLLKKLTSSNLIFLREMLFGTKKLSKLQKIGVCISSIKMSTAHT